MAIIEIKIPNVGESINEVEIASWLVKDGEVVAKNTEVAEIESNKATLTLIADEGGKIKHLVAQGDSIKVGEVAFTIDTSFEAPVQKAETPTKQTEKTASKPTATEEKKEEKKPKNEENEDFSKVKISPVAKQIMLQENLSVEEVIKGIRRLKKDDILAIAQANKLSTSGSSTLLKKEASRETHSERMSSLRRKLSERLVSVKNETAMLTTFNEVDMSAIMNLRKKYQDKFVEKYDIKLGFMSFFIKACSLALQDFPTVNGLINGEDIVTHEYTDISVAVSAPKGLMVPVIRNVETLGLAEIELTLKDLATKARNGKLSIPEMTGGTFTITNGGIFGSMLSTPIINPPQSAILGMHNILERPIAKNGQVVIRPMMYLALSYDHRIIDGKESVSFLVKVKQLLENPDNMLWKGKSATEILLEI